MGSDIAVQRYVPAYDLAGRLVGYEYAPRPAGVWDGNCPPVIGDRVGLGTVHAIAAYPEGPHRIFVRGDDGAVTETSLVAFVRAFRAALLVLLVLVPATTSAQDTPFKVATAGYVAAAMADLAITEYRLGQGGFREAGLGRGLEQRPVAFGLLKGSLTAGSLFAFQRLHRTRPKLATALTVAFTAIETMAAVHNQRLKRGGVR